MSTIEAQVQVLLDLAGITPPPDEVDQLIASFPQMRASLEKMWALDLGDTAPSLVFRAAEATGPAGGTDA